MRKGSCRSLSPARKFIVELLHHAKRVPSLPVTRSISLAEVAKARSSTPNPVSWLAIFVRAYGLVGKLHPELRTAYIPYPWPHLYEHPETLCTLPIEREWEGESVVLLAKVRGPENQSLRAIHQHLRRFKEVPVMELSDFRQIVRLSRMPWPWLRFAFWHTLYWSGACRAHQFGTCTVSSMGYLNATQHHPLTPLTSYLSSGPVQPDGRVDLTIIYDHRVMDDGHVARALRSLEAILQGQILDELRQDADGLRLSA